MDSTGFTLPIMCYGMSYLPRLRRLTREQVLKVAGEAQELSGQCPLHQYHQAEFKVPSFDPEALLTGGQVIALMVFGLWVLCGEDERLAAPLLDKWPIREVVMLTNAREAKEAQ